MYHVLGFDCAALAFQGRLRRKGLQSTQAGLPEACLRLAGGSGHGSWTAKCRMADFVGWLVCLRHFVFVASNRSWWASEVRWAGEQVVIE